MADNIPSVLVGSRVKLRRWLATDAGALCALVEDNLEHLRPWMPWAANEPLSVEQRVGLIETWATASTAGGDAVFGVCLGDQPIGSCGLHRRRGPHGLEIGYWIDKDFVGRGLATEAARVLTAAAFTVRDITFVEIHHDKANVASARIPEHLGYALLGETPDIVEAPGEVGVDCTWRMEANDWIEQ